MKEKTELLLNYKTVIVYNFFWIKNNKKNKYSWKIQMYDNIFIFICNSQAFMKYDYYQLLCYW